MIAIKWKVRLLFSCEVAGAPSSDPGLEKHGCHAMILASWSCHDDGMAAMFLSMVVMMHIMIMVWLLCFLWILSRSWFDHHVFNLFPRKWLFVNVFSTNCCHIPLYCTLDWPQRKLRLKTAESCFPWFRPWSWYDHHVFHVFFRQKIGLFVNVFSKQLLSYTIIWQTWLALEEFKSPKWRVSKVKRSLLQKDLEFSSVITKQQVPIKQQFQYNIHITAYI